MNKQRFQPAFAILRFDLDALRKPGTQEQLEVFCAAAVCAIRVYHTPERAEAEAAA